MQFRRLFFLFFTSFYKKKTFLKTIKLMPENIRKLVCKIACTCTIRNFYLIFDFDAS